MGKKRIHNNKAICRTSDLFHVYGRSGTHGTVRDHKFDCDEETGNGRTRIVFFHGPWTPGKPLAAPASFTCSWSNKGPRPVKEWHRLRP